MIPNLKNNKLTTSTGLGVGIATVAVIVLKAFKIDVGEIAGIPTETVVVNVGALISALINLVARDPLKLKKDKTAPEVQLNK